MATPATNLHQKLAEAALSIKGVEKDGRNDFHKYDYTSAEGLLRTVRGELLERGIVLLPSVLAIEERPVKTAKGNDSTVTTVRMEFALVDSETGEREDQTWAGTGDDPGDKGLYKAYTGAIKTFLRELLLLPMGDDPEADAQTDARNADGARKLREVSDKELEAVTGGKVLLTDDQRKRFKTAQKHLAWTDDDFAAWLKDELGPDASLDTLGTGDGNALLKILRDKVREVREATKAAA